MGAYRASLSAPTASPVSTSPAPSPLSPATSQQQQQQQQSSSSSCPSTSPHPSLCGRRMFLSSLIVAAKYIQDRNYSNKAWAKISGLPLSEINANELEFLKAIDYHLFVSQKTFVGWSGMLLNRACGRGGVGAGVSAGVKPGPLVGVPPAQNSAQKCTLTIPDACTINLKPTNSSASVTALLTPLPSPTSSDTASPFSFAFVPMPTASCGLAESTRAAATTVTASLPSPPAEHGCDGVTSTTQRGCGGVSSYPFPSPEAVRVPLLHGLKRSWTVCESAGVGEGVWEREGKRVKV
ncbi:hypothetical protein HK104_000986 [Borealophlyctis nickersoniae]|nr:hypothetical protein HK104_000986 [Borealophlyctis nickersoniae]